MEMIVEQEYDIHLDAKKRVTLRDADFVFFHVKKLKNGSYIFEPRELIDPEVLKQIDGSIKALKKGKKPKAVNLKKAPNV